MSTIKKIPKVVASGYLSVFDNIACYNLDNGQRVFRLSDMTLALRGKMHGKFGNYLAAENIRQHLPKRLWPDMNEDRSPQGLTTAELNGKQFQAYDSADFIDVCAAFVQASEEKEALLSIAQQQIVKRAKNFILATAKVGITGLIDEATGYQYIRPANELEIKFALFLSEEMQDWEKTFPDDLWKEFGRLTNWMNVKQRPKYWGKLVNEFVYEALDADIAKYLKENKPPRNTGVRYHQWLTRDKGVKALIQHIGILIGLAKNCETVDDLRFEVNKHFSKNLFQDMLWSRKQLSSSNQSVEKEKFDNLIKKAVKPSKETVETGEQMQLAD